MIPRLTTILVGKQTWRMALSRQVSRRPNGCCWVAHAPRWYKSRGDVPNMTRCITVHNIGAWCTKAVTKKERRRKLLDGHSYRGPTVSSVAPTLFIPAEREHQSSCSAENMESLGAGYRP